MEGKNHQQNPVSETSVSSIAAVYSLDAVWYQLLTGASCDRLRNFAYPIALSIAFGPALPQPTEWQRI
jgi:hypothetical protein